MKTDAEAIAAFLRLLWPEDSSGYLGFWSKAKVPEWQMAGVAPEAAPAIARAAVTRDVWLHVGLEPEPLSTRSRARADEIIAIPGPWADLDYADLTHAKSNLPPDEAAIDAFLADLPLQPSTVVHSGHGLQAWWLFREPWYFADDAERDHAAACVRGWQGFMRGRMRTMGWDLDGTYDLARLMRLPGTLNHKGDTAVPVRLLRHDDALRVNPSDFEPYIGAWGEETPVAPVQLQAQANGVVPKEMLDALLSASPRFRQTWERKRTDLQDQSGSGYDQSIADQLAAAGWEEQKIMTVLQQSAREHGDRAKALGYYQRTIGKAIGWAREREALRETPADLESHVNGDEPLTPADRAQLSEQTLRTIGAPRGYDLVLVIGNERDTYVLRGPKADADLGNDLYDYRRVRRVMLSRLGAGLRPSLKDWPSWVRTLRKFALVEYSGTMLAKQRVEAWVEAFCQEFQPQTVEPASRNTTLLTHPIIVAGYLRLRAETLGKFVSTSLGERIEVGHVQELLTLAGWMPTKVRSDDTGMRTWRAPDPPLDR